MTERVGASRLEEVVRQKEEWQREATVLFGKQESQKAIQAYQTRGHIHLVEEKLPDGHSVEDTVKRYESSARTSGLIFREILKDVQAIEGKNFYEKAKDHEDYQEFLKWRDSQKEAGKEILSQPEIYRSTLEKRCLDPLEMARLFVDKGQNKKSQYKEAAQLLKTKGLEHLIGIERAPGQGVEVRDAAKAALIEDWKKAYKEDQSLLMMAYSNRDVRDLNERAKNQLKASGDIGKEEFTYKITSEVEDDFGRKTKLREDRSFATGDRIVFTRNDGGLGVKNGSIGTILSLDKNKIEVRLDEGKTFGFSPNLFSSFDQGWAITIHKSQGTTVEKSFLLVSHEMNQNLTYVAMTRHKGDVQVYGSRCDFWREGKVEDILSKSGEKLSAADYLDSHSLAKLMKEEDRFISKLFTRLSDELHAMGAVSKQAFKSVANHFLGRTPERDLGRDIIIKSEVVREENRAQELFSQKKDLSTKEYISPALRAIYEEWKHPAFNKAEFIKKVFEKGLKIHGEEKAIAYWESKKEGFLQNYYQNIAKVETELNSPLLSQLTEKWKNKAREFAKQDPLKVLDLVNKLKNQEHERRERTAAEARAAQEQQLKQTPTEAQLKREHLDGVCLKFKQLDQLIKEYPTASSSYKEDLKQFAQELAQENDFMSFLKLCDAKGAKTIERIAGMSPDLTYNHGLEEHEYSHSMDRGRGGYSL